ncbi:MAG: hypothetical protein AB3N16_09100 [Flavobacteriaceae bacterium]
MRTFILALGIVSILSFGCKDDKKNSAPNKMKTVMAVHDEVMPRMGEIGKLVAELKAKEDSTEVGMRYTAARKELQEAHKGMMDWMQNFGNRFTPDEILNDAALTDEKTKWLDEEEINVQKVADDINTSIANAKRLLEQE